MSSDEKEQIKEQIEEIKEQIEELKEKQSKEEEGEAGAKTKGEHGSMAWGVSMGFLEYC
jgi:hypothetical protein